MRVLGRMETDVYKRQLLAPITAVGLKGIWWAVPIGWVLADLAGLVLWRRGESGGEAGPHAKCQSRCV